LKFILGAEGSRHQQGAAKKNQLPVLNVATCAAADLHVNGVGHWGYFERGLADLYSEGKVANGGAYTFLPFNQQLAYVGCNISRHY